MSLVEINENWTPADLASDRKRRKDFFKLQSPPTEEATEVSELKRAVSEVTARMAEIADELAKMREEIARERKAQAGRKALVTELQELRAQLVVARKRILEIEPTIDGPEPPKIERIVAVAARYYGFRVAELKAPRRPANLVRARQVAMYVCKELTMRSFPEIGRRIGSRDHTTVLHAVRKMADLRLKDASLCQEIVEIEGLVG